MGWKGPAIGGYIGSLFGGHLGAIIGAALGHSVEKHIAAGTKRRPTFASAYSQGQRSRIFCTSAAAMLAKMAKADGRVTREEIEAGHALQPPKPGAKPLPADAVPAMLRRGGPTGSGKCRIYRRSLCRYPSHRLVYCLCSVLPR